MAAESGTRGTVWDGTAVRDETVGSRWAESPESTSSHQSFWQEEQILLRESCFWRLLNCSWHCSESFNSLENPRHFNIARIFAHRMTEPRTQNGIQPLWSQPMVGTLPCLYHVEGEGCGDGAWVTSYMSQPQAIGVGHCTTPPPHPHSTTGYHQPVGQSLPCSQSSSHHLPC